MSHLSFYVHGIELYMPYVWQMEINSFSESNFTVSPVSVLRNIVSCKSLFTQNFFKQDLSQSGKRGDEWKPERFWGVEGDKKRDIGINNV